MPRLRPASLRLLLLFGAALSDSPARPSVQPSSDVAVAPVNLAAVMRQVHFAWRPDGAGWSASHATWDAHLEAGRLRFQPQAAQKGLPVEFGAPRLSRGQQPLGDAPAQVGNTSTGDLSLARPDVVEVLHGSEAGVEQTWRFEAAPRGEGALVVRVPVLRGRFLAETSRGLHFSSGALSVAYGHGAWVDARGQRTFVPARFESDAIVLSVPHEVLEASAWPAVLDPVIGPEFTVGEPVPSVAYTEVSPPDVASDGSSFLVVWQDRRSVTSDDIYGARVTATGAVQDVAGIPISTAAGPQRAPRVAWDGANYLVVWEDGRGADLDIYAARVSAAGAVRDPQGIPVNTGALDQRHPDVVTRGTGAFIVWEDLRLGLGVPEIRGARVNGAGGVQDPAGLPIATEMTEKSSPSAAWDGTNVLVVWEDRRHGNPDIYATRVDPSGLVLDGTGIGVSAGIGAQTRPVATFTGSAFVVAWQDDRNGNPDVYAARVSTTGVALDPTGIAVGVAPGEQSSPSLASSATHAVVVWRDGAGGQLRGARVTNAGTVLDAPGVALAPAPTHGGTTSLAYSSTNALVAWNAGAAISAQVKALRVTPALMPLGTPAVVSMSANHQQKPAVAWGDANALVVWADFRSGVDLDVYAARVSRAGTVLDPAGIAIATGTGRQDNPDVAWDGSRFLVAWEGESVTASDIYAARVSPAGAVLDATPVVVSSAAGPQTAPAVAFDGTQFLVTWTDGRTSATDTDIYGARVDGTGAVLDAAGVAISTAAGVQDSPDVAFDGTHALVVWSDGRGGAGLDARDVYGARVTAAGVVLDTMGLPLVTASGGQVLPAVARMGTGDLLLTWTDARNASAAAYAARVDATGAVLDGTGVLLSAASTLETAVAWDGTGALVVMAQGPAATPADVLATRVSLAGAVLDTPPLSLSTSASTVGSPAVACDGARQCLVLWEGFDTSAAAHAYRLFARTLTRGEAPVATPQSVVVDEDSSVAITLAGTDADGDALTFSVVTQPLNGALGGTPPTLTFTPVPDFNGTTSFTFRANDGILDSTPATVTVAVRPVNDAPVATPGTATAVQGVATALTLRGTDIDGDALTFSVATPPAHGTVSGAGARVTYTSAADFTGTDSFTFMANDGTVDSAPATFTVTVVPATGGGRGGGAGGGGGSADAGVGGGGGGGGGCGCASAWDAPALAGVLVGVLGRRRRWGRPRCADGWTPSGAHRIGA